jgi:hypothetical protein
MPGSTQWVFQNDSASNGPTYGVKYGPGSDGSPGTSPGQPYVAGFPPGTNLAVPFSWLPATVYEGT